MTPEQIQGILELEARGELSSEKLAGVNELRHRGEFPEPLAPPIPSPRTAEPRRPFPTGFLPYAARGAAFGLGSPIDASNWIAKQFGFGYPGSPGRESVEFSMEQLAKAYGGGGDIFPEKGRKPQSIEEYLGQGTGEGLGFATPFGLGTKSLQRLPGLGGKVATALTPTKARTAAYEATAGTGVGLGRYVGQDIPKDTWWGPSAHMGVELAGGASPTAAAKSVKGLAKVASQYLPIVSQAWRLAEASVLPFTERGAWTRARRRMQGLVDDPADVAKRLNEETLEPMSPARQSGEPNLMALEDAIKGSDVHIKAEMDAMHATSTKALADRLKLPGEISKTIDFLDRQRMHLSKTLDELVAQARQRAEKAKAAVGPRLTKEQASQIQKDELEAAYKAGRDQEDIYWGDVDKDVMAPATEARTFLRALIVSTPSAQQKNIPIAARERLEMNTKVDEWKSSDVTVNEMHGLYSDLRETARVARSQGKKKLAKNASDIADKILTDMGSKADPTNAVGKRTSVTPNGVKINKARDFSHDLNNRFNKGTVGKILGSTREGGEAVPGALALETAVGSGGSKGVVGAEDIRAATGGHLEKPGAIQAWLRSGFEESNFSKSFIDRYKALLDKMPRLQREFREAAEATKAAERSEKLAPKIHKRLRESASILNEKGGVRAIVNAPNQRRAAGDVRARAEKDPTGEALDGIQADYTKYLVDESSVGNLATTTEEGVASLSGRSMRQVLNKTAAVVKQWFSPAQEQRLTRIAAELARHETAGMKLGKEKVGDKIMDDKTATLLNFLGTFLAAKSGGRIGQDTGSSLKLAQFMSTQMQKMLKGFTNDSAAQLIKDAVNDKPLYQALLMPMGPKRAVIDKRIGAWMAGPAAHLYEQEDDG
tara:strand:+ start:2973 stop:5627 length:2655 start_codon:yes stop_codon:yes gene_type:complete